MIVAYSGMLNSGYFARHEFSSMEAGVNIAWTDGAIWGLHDTAQEVTEADKEWSRQSVQMAERVYCHARQHMQEDNHAE